VAHYGPGAVFTFVDGYSGTRDTTETLVTFTRKGKWIKLYNDDGAAATLQYRVSTNHLKATLLAGESIELPLAAPGIYLDSGSSTAYRIVVVG
jgi:hypothetical protein